MGKGSSDITNVDWNKIIDTNQLMCHNLKRDQLECVFLVMIHRVPHGKITMKPPINSNHNEIN